MRTKQGSFFMSSGCKNETRKERTSFLTENARRVLATIRMTEITEKVSVDDSLGDVTVESISEAVRPAIEVVAPVDMHGGFEFEVNMGSRTLRVKVPDEGVMAGQKFIAWVMDDLAAVDEQTATLSGWKDTFFDCFRYGCCHPLFCLACWCAPCALGQVMTRIKLNLLANPRATDEKTFWTPFKFLFAMTAGYILIRVITQAIIDYKADCDDERDEEDSYPAWADAMETVRVLIFLAFFVFVTVLITKTRRFLRRKKNIPAENCGKIEDCCLAFWCPCCTICHMARSTGDYEKYGARCCSETGLDAEVPMYV